MAALALPVWSEWAFFSVLFWADSEKPSWCCNLYLRRPCEVLWAFMTGSTWMLLISSPEPKAEQSLTFSWCHTRVPHPQFRARRCMTDVRRGYAWVTDGEHASQYCCQDIFVALFVAGIIWSEADKRVGMGNFFFPATGSKPVLSKRYPGLNGAWTDT